MRGARRGFTLIEVLAAIVLMAIVLPVAMHAISVATMVGDSAKRRAEAAMLAQSKLNEMIVIKAWKNGALSGQWEDHPDYRWSAEMRDWDSSALKELDLHVIWTAAGREQNVTLSTLVDTEAN
jgi:general secretion pathway protein I